MTVSGAGAVPWSPTSMAKLSTLPPLTPRVPSWLATAAGIVSAVLTSSRFPGMVVPAFAVGGRIGTETVIGIGTSLPATLQV